jgi:hypothetical protein
MPSRTSTTIATSIRPVLQVQTLLVNYAPEPNRPRIAKGNIRSVWPARMPHGTASATVCAFRSVHGLRLEQGRSAEYY